MMSAARLYARDAEPAELLIRDALRTLMNASLRLPKR